MNVSRERREFIVYEVLARWPACWNETMPAPSATLHEEIVRALDEEAALEATQALAHHNDQAKHIVQAAMRWRDGADRGELARAVDLFVLCDTCNGSGDRRYEFVPSHNACTACGGSKRNALADAAYSRNSASTSMRSDE